MKLKKTGKFEANLRELIKSDIELAREVERSVIRFRKNPKDTRLQTHALKRRLEGNYAFSVNDDVRIVFEFTGKNTVRFLNIGKHVDVYSRF